MRWIVLFSLLLVSTARGQNSVFYAGGTGVDRFDDILQLSDGSFLIVGATESLDWIPADAVRIPLPGDKIEGSPGGASIGIVLHVAADLQSVRAVAHFPPGAVETVRRVRTSARPGEKTGAIVIAALTNENKRDPASGTVLARLDANFVDAVPTGLAWIRNVWTGNTNREYSAFDLTSTGEVYYVSGKDFHPDWVALYRLTPDGADDVVENWRFHLFTRPDGSQASGHFTPASSAADGVVNQSGVVFKLNRPDLRSWTPAAYEWVHSDGNGGTRQGKWPNDYYFNGPASPEGGETAGPGYTGYRTGKNATGRVVAVAVDRSSDDVYVGFSFQSRLPDGNPDFEPAVISFDKTGQLRWWTRLYEENATNSTPDQYVDGLDIDYSSSQLVVLARCHGNNETNLWPGNDTFQPRFTGKNGNIHIGWLGRFQTAGGVFVNSTFVAEPMDNPKGKPLEDGPFAGWPPPTAGWQDLNTTRVRDMRVDASGRVFLTSLGKHTRTTANAWMQNYKPGEGVPQWNKFVRVYSADLKSVEYSSIVGARWDPITGEGDSDLDLRAILPIEGGLIAVGFHETHTQADRDAEIENLTKRKREIVEDKLPQPGQLKGAPLPAENAPAWGGGTTTDDAAVIVKLKW
jgi:hypothetical protein